MPSSDTRFKPGSSGNPTGRGKGNRNKLTTDFLRDLSEDWAKHGKSALIAAREESPSQYVRTVAGLMEKHHKVEIPILEELKQLSKNELETRIIDLGRSLRNRGVLPSPESVRLEGPANKDRPLLS